ncbi:hypothetical protein [Pseudomonas fluorescens]|uniref:hypothetical protein n=1 Tax=Pseudomonas fluorescens TaxID=294 RepID=UPI001BEAE436|nr:hypothetical protein [Pseudomonas fluorescens]MBT2373292.1 hypothetical protein [Pseudomonas fluorescens]
MISNLFKVVMIAGTLLLGACSGVSTSTSSCPAEGCQSFGDHVTGSSNKKANFGGSSAIGSSFNAYSSGLLHD